MFLSVAVAAIFAAGLILVIGVTNSFEQRRSRRQLPPRPEPGGHVREGGRRGGTGDDPVPPGPRTDQTRADLRAHGSRQHRREIAARAVRGTGGVRPAFAVLGLPASVESGLITMCV